MTTVPCPACGNVIEVPDKKTGLWWGIGCLVAALGLPVLVAIIGLLAAIAIPSFVRAREMSQHHACLNNMRMLAAAKEQAALQHNYRSGDFIPEEQIAPFLKGCSEGLHCPGGGRYTIHAIGQDPECSVHGRLPPSAGEGAQRSVRPDDSGLVEYQVVVR